jgi:hypothetical protein
LNREIAADPEPAEAAAPAPAEDSEALARAAAKALRSAADRLGVEADSLATRCTEGELADVIIELRVARFNLPAADQERVEELLRKIGVLP